MVKNLISCVVCSRQQDISVELNESIALTIGCEYELIVIDNSKNDYTIFSAYNEGIRRAKGNILCFMHDDIIYHTHNWGINVIEHFQNNMIGLLGIMGGHFLPNFPASWISSYMLSGQNIQGYFDEDKYKTKYYEFCNRKVHNSTEVVAVDGMWFCVPKNVFNTILFDDKLFNGFHCYDLDICMQIIKNNMQVHVAHDILIEHQSCGNMDVVYFNELDKFFNKWRSYFPIIRGIDQTPIDIQERMLMAENYMSVLRENIFLKNNLQKISSSYYFKLIKKTSKIFITIKTCIKYSLHMVTRISKKR